MNISQLNKLEDNSQLELKIADIDKFDATLDDYVKKLRYTGKIYIDGVDYIEFSRQAFLRKFDEEHFNSVVGMRFKLSNMQTMLENCTKLGLKVVEKYFDDYNYHIVAERVKNV